MTLYDFNVNTLRGKSFDLNSLKGKKVLIVNTASECGLTPQYEQLEELYKETSRDEFEILAFPCDQFGNQEPGGA
ncbi:MAG: glutathione peroxidase, partial [Bacteroidota bacterium]